MSFFVADLYLTILSQNVTMRFSMFSLNVCLTFCAAGIHMKVNDMEIDWEDLPERNKTETALNITKFFPKKNSPEKIRKELVKSMFRYFEWALSLQSFFVLHKFTPNAFKTERIISLYTYYTQQTRKIFRRVSKPLRAEFWKC